LSKHKEKIDKIRFSYSSLSGFHGCRHAWYLTYIERHERSNNFFAEYGLLVHEVLEKFFRDELEVFELSDYYSDNFDRMVVSPPPPFINKENYFKQGWEFFENFDFDKDKYEVLVIEDKIDVDSKKYNLVIKPDLVLKSKETGESFLVDYKTSIIEKKGKVSKKDKEKLNGYIRQMTMYATYLKTKDIIVDGVWLWFVRQEENKFYKFEVLPEDEKELDKWITETVKEISEEEEFKPSVDKFFCLQLCSVSAFCKFKPQEQT
jgi:hypothetical protein